MFRSLVAVAVAGFEPLTADPNDGSDGVDPTLDYRVSGAYDFSMARSAARRGSIDQEKALLQSPPSRSRLSAAAPAGSDVAQTEPRPERLAYTVEEAALVVGVGRDLLYDEIRTGRLRSKKAGSRRVIAKHHLLEWLDSDMADAARRAGCEARPLFSRRESTSP